MRIVLLSGAKRELFAAAAWYDDQRRGLGAAFLDELSAAFTRIAAHPEASTPTIRDYRRALVRRFPYSLIYRSAGDRLIVVAIVHHRRRPLYWLRRVSREDGRD